MEEYTSPPPEPNNELARTRHNTSFYNTEEKNTILPWAIYRSTLLPKDGADRQSYQNTFGRLVPEASVNIKEYIENALSAKKGRAIALDIGGLGSDVFKDFSYGFFAKTAGVALVDTRKKYKININGDSERNHSVIEGNILTPDTQEKIKVWLNGEKVDLILERMEGGLELFPRDERWFYAAANEVYNLLSDNGIMFMQLVFSVAGDEKNDYFVADLNLIEDWIKKIRAEHPQTLKINWDGQSLLIQKMPGAPEKLPKI